MENVKEKYNKSAKDYSLKHESRDYWLENFKKESIDYLDSNPSNIVIDIGCGSGVLLKELAPKYPLIKFIGIDFSEELIELAKKDNPFNIEFKVADFIKSGRTIIENLNI